MQVSPVSRPAPPTPQRDPSRQTLVAGLLLSLTPPMAPFRTEPAELTDQLRSQRQQSLERRPSATQADRQDVTQTLRDRERLMRPGSHAFRQTLRREQRLRDAAKAARPSQAGGQPNPVKTADDAPADPRPVRGRAPRPAPAPRGVTDTPAEPPASRPRVLGDAATSPPAERGARPAPNPQAAPPPAVQSRPAPAVAATETRVISVTRSGAAEPFASPGRTPAHSQAARVEPAPPAGAAPRDRTAGARIGPARAATDPAETRAQRQQRIERIVRVIRHSLRHGQTRTTLRLDPPALGKLRIDIELHDSSLHLRFEPAHELAHRLLNRQVDELAAALRAAGLEPQRIEIQPAPGTPPHGTHADAGAHHGGAANGGHPHAAHSRSDTTVTTDHGDAPNAQIHSDSPTSDGVLQTTVVNVWA